MSEPAGASVECATCRANRGALTTPGGVLYEDPLWRLEHAFEPVPLLGWLVLKPRRHVEALAALTDAEMASLGPLVKRVTVAMEQVLEPVKVYLCMYAESREAPHVHFHLIPRYADTPPERRGPGAFDYMREARAAGRNLADLAAVERAAAAIRQRLAPVQPDRPAGSTAPAAR